VSYITGKQIDKENRVFLFNRLDSIFIFFFFSFFHLYFVSCISFST